MHKKLEAELASLAHSILQMKDRDQAVALKEKARVLYEKLSILVFVEDYLKSGPLTEVSEEDIIHKLKSIAQSSNTGNVSPQKEVVPHSDKPKEPVINQQSKEDDDNIFEPKFDSVRIDIESLKSNQISSKEEFRDAISADKTASLFDNLGKESTERKTLNDRLVKDTIQVGLNDRLAFVKHLFNSEQSDFNRVLSQLNTFQTEREAVDFIKNTIKPEYDWSGKEEYEERLLTLIERKFS